MRVIESIYTESQEMLVLGLSRWRKQVLRAELEEGEDPVKASTELKKMVDQIHAINNADVAAMPKGEPGYNDDIPPLPETKERVEYRNLLKKCKTIADLLANAKKGKGMRDIYEQRLNQLKEKQNAGIK